MIKTIIAFAIVLVIFIIGFIIWKSKNNYLTMIAVVLVLPAAKFAVSYFVLIPHKNCDEELKNAIEKMTMYLKNGIIPGKNLIITYETSRHPLSVRSIETFINEYLV